MASAQATTAGCERGCGNIVEHRRDLAAGRAAVWRVVSSAGVQPGRPVTVGLPSAAPEDNPWQYYSDAIDLASGSAS